MKSMQTLDQPLQPLFNSNSISSRHQPLREFVERMLEGYFQRIDPLLPPTSLYNLVIEEVELPLLKSALNFAKGNQSKASFLLGISRSTLRKKLKLYGLAK